MQRLRYYTLTLVILLATSLISSIVFAAPTRDEPRQRSKIDLVIALDTSGSMDGLIDSARQKIWDIVNDLATAKPTPMLRVGLISFGNDGYRDEGWTRVDVGLTQDLDTVYERLMALRTNGGTEYVGRAIYKARTGMNWDADKRALKLLFVAGNESADQDPTFKAIPEAGKAIAQDIIVNTIFCGTSTDRIASGWRDVAARADGQFASIDQRRDTVAISTPMDKKLSILSNKLNSTYIAYGTHGSASKVRQERVDKEAMAMSEAAGASRAAAKSSALYSNAKWDLIDGIKDSKVSLDDMQPADMPAEMKGMSKARRKIYIKEKMAKRMKIQAEIAALSKKRDAYIRKERSKNKTHKAAGFDSAIRKTIRKQARKKGIILP